MTIPAVRILSARLSGADDPQLSDKALQQAREAGFDALQCPVPSWISESEGQDIAAQAGRCRAAGLRLIAEIDLTRFPVDHPLVQANPEAFAIRRSARGPVPIDPRKDMPAAGEAIARLRTDRHADVFADPLGERLHALVGQGVRGFRIMAAERIAPALLKRLIGQARQQEADLLFIAGPLGEDREVAGALAKAGVDFLVSSFAWWDLRAPWFLEELDELRACGPVLAEIRSDQSSGESASTRLAAASALCSGVIAPADFLSSDRIRDDAARAAALASEAGDYSGPLVRLSASSAPVTVLLRPDDADLRSAEGALIVMINQGSQSQPVPDPSTLSSAAGAFADPQPLAAGRDASAPLQPGEVRLLKVARSQPITHGPPSFGSFRDLPRLVIEDISPSVEGGDFPVKRVVGDTVTVEATVFTDGHEQLAAELRWRPVDEDQWSATRMTQLPNDRWRAEFPVERMGRHEFVVEGWLDRFGGFQRDFGKKWDAEVAQDVDHAEGRMLVQEAAGRSEGELRSALEDYLNRLTQAKGEESARLLLDENLGRLMADADDRHHALVSPRQLVDAERIEARFSSWYELFPRSITEDKDRHGTFADVIGILPHVRDMGFDTLYFPPIHPIGKTNRKGPNNTLTPGPDDPGSPYAIGSKDGGHDAIHPELGTFEDFDRLVKAAADHGLEIALDFAIQASPDHPWLKEHPGWFAWRPDGSMKYAENPPKKYQDIVNVDFYGPDAVPGLWEALRDVILLWVEHGVKTFRVDNPHTKPLPFWEWMIAEVRARHPEVIFLSEAFTRPTMMYRLAKIGFSQSYTYFTWRDRKQELMEYITELTTTAPKEFYRPNFFVNTPDINPHYLQTSGRPGFRIRAVLAATLSGLWGVYSGFELCEFEPLGPGKEEYLDSEKFEIRPRPQRTPGDIVHDVTLLNRLRRAHPALQTHLNTRFYPAYDDNILWYGKPSPDGNEMIMVMVNLDPHNAHECDFEIPLWELGINDDGTVAVEDLAHGHRFDWSGKTQRIRLAPDEPYRIWRLSVPGGAA